MSATDTAEPKGRRLSRKKAADAPQIAPGKLVPTATAFDLLHGAYEKVRRARLIQLIASGVALITVVGVVVLGVTTYLETGQIEASKASQQAQLAERQRDLIEIANIGPLQRDQMQSYIDTRGADLAAVTAGDLALVEILDQLQTVFPAGVEVQSLVVAPTGASASSSSAAADDLLDDGEGAPAPDTAPAASSREALHTITLTAQVPGFAALEQLVAATANLALFADTPEVTWSGGSEGLSVTLTGQVAPETQTRRATTTAAQLTVQEAPTAGVADDQLTPGELDSSLDAPDDGPQLDLSEEN